MSDGTQPEGPPEGLGKLLAGEAQGEAAVPYRVLARKYRPSAFPDLIGQEAMVKTLSNAFELERIHQAYMLTGVRGVGKTTTARILARGLNYSAAPATRYRSRPIPMPELGTHCQAIIESRHVDVIEMDAASHTGIDDVREIIDGSRYRPVIGAHKVYIIDEVHMLSEKAFNGLLKTLEEPPRPRQVPVRHHGDRQGAGDGAVALPALRPAPRRGAGAGRAPRPDLRARRTCRPRRRRSPCIARAAEGSVRDALSLLDQAIALGAGAGGRSTPRACAPCSGWPTARASSTCSSR